MKSHGIIFSWILLPLQKSEGWIGNDWVNNIHKFSIKIQWRFKNVWHPPNLKQPNYFSKKGEVSEYLSCDSKMTTDSFNNDILIGIFEKVGKENKIDI